MGVHDEHRKRRKELFLKDGMDHWADHEVLEMLLFFGIPYKDTNDLAHQLMQRYGSLPDVFEASFEDLCQVKGIGAHAATLLCMIPYLLRRYYDRANRKTIVLKDTKDIVAFLQPQFLGRKTEWFYMICENGQHGLLFSDFLFEGSINAVAIRVRDIVEQCLRCKATGVILAHNHPAMLALPSNEDVRTTKTVYDGLRSVGIRLRDHIILSGDDAVSMRESGIFDRF